MRIRHLSFIPSPAVSGSAIGVSYNYDSKSNRSSTVNSQSKTVVVTTVFAAVTSDEVDIRRRRHVTSRPVLFWLCGVDFLY